MSFRIADAEKAFVDTNYFRLLDNLKPVSRYDKVEIRQRSGETSGGYLGVTTFKMPDYQPVNVEINASARNIQEVKGERCLRPSFLERSNKTQERRPVLD